MNVCEDEDDEYDESQAMDLALEFRKELVDLRKEVDIFRVRPASDKTGVETLRKQRAKIKKSLNKGKRIQLKK